MWKLLAIAFVIGSFFSSETQSTSSTSFRNSHPRYDRDVESGPPPIVREYLQNLYNYRPQTAALEEEAVFRSYNNNFNPIGPDSPGAPNAPGPVPDSENMESRSRDNYNHYQRPGSNDRGDRGDRGPSSPFPPNPPYHQHQRGDAQQRGTTRGPRLPPPQSPFQDDNGQGLLNTFRDRDAINRDDADYNLSDLPDEDEVELDAPFPNLNPNPRYNPNPNYNQRPPIRRPSGSGSPAQASCGGGGCGGGGGGGKGSGGGGLPKPPGNLYDDQTGRERGDPSYRFGYDLKDQSRHENADRFGNVNGYFSFVDDEGTFNKVSYSAGAAKGFVVNHKEPADASAAAQPPQRTRSTNLRRNPSDGGGAHRRNSNHASSYPPNPNPRQHHNPYGKQYNNNNRNQNNRQNQNQNQVPNTLNNNNGGDQPSQDEQLLGAGLGIVVGLTNSNKGGGGGGRGGIREGRGGGDSWSRSKGPGAGAGSGPGTGVGSSTVVTTISSIGGDSNGGGRSHNSPHSSSDDPFGTVNGTSDGGDGGDGDGGDKGSWGALGGHGNPQNGNPRQRGGGMRKRKPAYIVKVTKRPAGNGPAWQYYKHANPGRPAPGSGPGDNRNHKWQNKYPRNNRPLPPPQNILTQSNGQSGSKSQGGLPLPLDGAISYDGTDGQDEYDLYPKDKSYSFGYKTGDSTRQEASDAYGNIRGSYSYVDPAGISRVVHYTAGNSGFKVLNAQPSILRPVYADSPVSVRGVPLPVSVQSLRSIPIPVPVQVAVTSSHQLRQLQQPSAIVYHIHPDNGIGSDWKPWESSRLQSLGPIYRHNSYSHRSRNSHQFAPLISGSNSNKKSRSHRYRSQKQQILQGNTFRLTHQNHRFFPAYDNIYDDQSQSFSQLSQQGEHADASASQDVTFSNPTFIDVNPDDVETISSDQLVNGLDNSADIEANQLYLKQLQRQQIRQQNKLRRLSQQYQQQIISTPVFQYSRRSQNDQLNHQRYSSRPSHSYFYRDRLQQQQYPYSPASNGDDNEILWTQPDQQYSDYQLSPFSVGSQSNVVSVVVPHSNLNNNNSGGTISTIRGNSNNIPGGDISTGGENSSNNSGGNTSTRRGNGNINSGGSISTSQGLTNNNSGGNISTGRSTISTFPPSSNGNRRRSSSRERGGLKRSSSSNWNENGNRRNGNSVMNSREKSVPLAPIKNSNSSGDQFMSFDNTNSNNVMNITEIFTSPAPRDVPPTASIPIATPPMTMTVTMATPAPSKGSMPASVRVAVIEPADPDMQAYQGGYGVKHPLLPRPQSQSIETEMGGGPPFSPGPRPQREIPFETMSDSVTGTGTGTGIDNTINSVQVAEMEAIPPTLMIPVMDITELDMVALPVMPLGLVVPGDDSQMAESIMNSVIIASSLVKGEEPGLDRDPESGSLELLRIYPKERKQNISVQNSEMEFGGGMKMKGKKVEEFDEKSKPEPTARPIPTTTTTTSTTTTTTTMKPVPIPVKADPEPIVKMSPAARLAAKLASPTSTSTAAPTSTSSPTTTTTTTVSPSTLMEKEGQASSNIVLSTALVFPMMMSNSGMVVHYPGGKMGANNQADALMSHNSSQEIMMMTA